MDKEIQMKLTKEKLRKMIKEELSFMMEGDYMMEDDYLMEDEYIEPAPAKGVIRFLDPTGRYEGKDLTFDLRTPAGEFSGMSKGNQFGARSAAKYFGGGPFDERVRRLQDGIMSVLKISNPKIQTDNNLARHIRYSIKMGLEQGTLQVNMDRF